MAEKNFGVKQVNLIGASGTPTIESPNNININAVNVAISTDMSVGGSVGISSNLSITGIVTAASFFGDGSGLTGVASTDNIQTATEAEFLSGVKIAGVTTASGGIIGDVTGDVTGTATNAQGLTGTPSITVNAVTSANINNTGVITASSFVGDGSALTGIIATGTGSFVSNSVGIHTTRNIGIATNSAKSDVALFVRGDARITGILSIGQGTVTIDGDNNNITASTITVGSGGLQVEFPTDTDYGNLDNTINDAFGQQISSATVFDALSSPTKTLSIQDFGVLT